MDLGISSRKKCRSVLLFSKMPFSELNRVSIGVTRESSTSVALCHLLLEERYHNTARFRKGLQVQDAAWLVIGDQALREDVRSAARSGMVVRDGLGHRMVGLAERAFRVRALDCPSQRCQASCPRHARRSASFLF